MFPVSQCFLSRGNTGAVCVTLLLHPTGDAEVLRRQRHSDAAGGHQQDGPHGQCVCVCVRERVCVCVL